MLLQAFVIDVKAVLLILIILVVITSGSSGVGGTYPQAVQSEYVTKSVMLIIEVVAVFPPSL